MACTFTATTVPRAPGCVPRHQKNVPGCSRLRLLHSNPNLKLEGAGSVSGKRPIRGTCVSCRAQSGSLYEVLGVPETATTKEIKSAYRKKAMKLHPDVNKAPNAKEQFMECKTAYDTLVDEQSRAQYDRARKGGFGSGLGGDFGADWDSFNRYARQAAQSAPSYSYSDLMRDLDKEIENWQKEREKRKGRRAEGVADVLGDVAEEFMQFLEMEAGLDGKQEKSSKSKSSESRKGTSSYSSSSWSSGPSTTGPSTSSSGPRTRTQGTQTEEQGRTREEDVAARAAREAAEAAARSARIAEIEAERRRKEAAKAGEIEDELAALKRKLGK